MFRAAVVVSVVVAVFAGAGASAQSPAGPRTSIPAGKWNAGQPISTAALRAEGAFARGGNLATMGGTIGGAIRGGIGGGLIGPNTYFCGFEAVEASGNYVIGPIDQQGNATGPQGDLWDKSAASALASASVSNTAPLLSGARYLKIIEDPAPTGTTIAAFSPVLVAAAPPSAGGDATFICQMRLSAPANFIGADYDIQPQAPSQGFLTARVKFSDFTNPGMISVLDDPGVGLVFVNTGIPFPKNATFTLTICLDFTNDQIIYLLNGVQFYASQAGVFAGSAIEECLVRSDNFQQGNGDFACVDQWSITPGVAACSGLPGACCFSLNPGGAGVPNCSQQTAVNCAISGGTFAGTGASCTFANCPPDECGSGGSCFAPTPGLAGCADVECCAAVCAIDLFCCDSNSGEWDGGCVALASANCTLPGLCAQPDAHCQRPMHGAGQGAGGILAATSDRNAGFAVADNFSAGGASINGVCWSGIYADFTGGGAVACDGAPPIGAIAFDAFEVTYYNDDSGVVPGSVLAGPLGIVVSAKQDTGFTIGGGAFAIFEYLGTHAPVSVTPGQCYWIEITNATDDAACFWLWETAPPGDSRSAQEDEGDGYDAGDLSDYDLAWCLSIPVDDPVSCVQFGACCNNVSGTCLDNVNAVDCILPTQRFEVDTLCANLVPTCGAGACCLPNGNCVNVVEIDCAAQAGQWYLAIFCGTVICNAFETCEQDNGLPNLNGPSPASQYAPGEFYAEAADNFTFMGEGDNGCRLTGLRWWAGHFNHDAGGCYACTNDRTPCNPIDPAACANVPANCQLVAPCSDTPADYASVRVTIYEDAFAGGQVKIVDGSIAGAVAIPDNIGGPGGGADCAGPGDCPAGSTCFDNDGDGDNECCATDELVAALGPGLVIDLDVEMVVAHTWQGDLVATLQKIGGPTVRLMRKPGDTDLHPTGPGVEGYSADNFGDPLGLGPRVRIDDQAAVAINVYGGAGAGVANYAGPAKSGGGGEPAGVLAAFQGLPKDGTWRIRVSDEFQTTDSGALVAWSIIFVNGAQPMPKNPDGMPEIVEQPVPCTVDQDCIDLGGTTCGLIVSGECDDLTVTVPTGGHSGAGVLYELVIAGPFVENVDWTIFDNGGTPSRADDTYEMTLDLSSAIDWASGLPINVTIEKNAKSFLAISPEVPFAGFYQTAWRASQNFNGNPARQILDPLLLDWTFVGGGGWDLAFQLFATKGPTFAPVIEFPAAGEATRLTAADLDGAGALSHGVRREGLLGGVEDCAIDVIVVIPGPNPALDGAVQVFLNDGNDGSGNWLGLTALVPVIVGREPSSVVAADFDGDSLTDVAVTNAGDDDVYVLFNNGPAAGIFDPPVIVTSASFDRPSAIAAGDFTGDGIIDLAVANELGADVVILESQLPLVGPPFVEIQTIAVGAAPMALEPEDVDNDKDLDLFSGNSGSDTASALRNTIIGGGVGTPFAAQVPLTVGDEPVDIEVVDIDGDGFGDVVTANRLTDDVSIVLGTGPFAFASEVSYAVGSEPTSVVADDLDEDGDVDIAVIAVDAAIGSSVQVRMNITGRLLGPALAFDPAVAFSVDADPNSVISIDVDNNGYADLVTANADGGITGGSVSVLLGVEACPADIGGDGQIGFADLTGVLINWGGCPEAPESCPWDVNGDCAVGFADLTQLLINWGDCE